jgi:hypothetical protein
MLTRDHFYYFWKDPSELQGCSFRLLAQFRYGSFVPNENIYELVPYVRRYAHSYRRSATFAISSRHAFFRFWPRLASRAFVRRRSALRWLYPATFLKSCNRPLEALQAVNLNESNYVFWW